MELLGLEDGIAGEGVGSRAVLSAIKQAHVVGGGMQEFINKVAAGDKEAPVDVTYPPATIATAMQLTAAHFYTPAPVRGTYIIGAPLITKENAKEFIDPKSPF